jgi:hypothetical protein
MTDANKQKFLIATRLINPNDPRYKEFECYFTICDLVKEKTEGYKVKAAHEIMKNLFGVRNINVSKIRHLPVEQLIQLSVAAQLMREAMDVCGLGDNGGFTNYNGGSF